MPLEVWIISGHPTVSRLVIAFTYFFVCTYATSLGPVSWLYSAEIYPMKVRAKAMAISTSTNWIFVFALAWANPPGLAHIAYRMYFMYGAFNILAFVHVFFCFPETKGLTLEEVEDVFNAKGSKFAAWRKVGRVGVVMEGRIEVLENSKDDAFSNASGDKVDADYVEDGL